MSKPLTRPQRELLTALCAKGATVQYIGQEKPKIYGYFLFANGEPVRPLHRCHWGTVEAAISRGWVKHPLGDAWSQRFIWRITAAGRRALEGEQDG